MLCKWSDCLLLGLRVAFRCRHAPGLFHPLALWGHAGCVQIPAVVSNATEDVLFGASSDSYPDRDRWVKGSSILNSPRGHPSPFCRSTDSSGLDLGRRTAGLSEGTWGPSMSPPYKRRSVLALRMRPAIREDWLSQRWAGLLRLLACGFLGCPCLDWTPRLYSTHAMRRAVFPLLFSGLEGTGARCHLLCL